MQTQLMKEVARLAAGRAMVGMEVDGEFLRVSNLPAERVVVWLRGEVALRVLREVPTKPCGWLTALERISLLMRPEEGKEAESAVVSWQSRSGTRYHLGDRVRHRNGPTMWGTLAGFFPMHSGACELWVKRDEPWPSGDYFDWWATYHLAEGPVRPNVDAVTSE